MTRITSYISVITLAYEIMRYSSLLSRLNEVFPCTGFITTILRQCDLYLLLCWEQNTNNFLFHMRDIIAIQEISSLTYYSFDNIGAMAFTCDHLTAVSGVSSSPALATCETRQVLLAGVSGGFPGVLPFRPTYQLARLYE